MSGSIDVLLAPGVRPDTARPAVAVVVDAVRATTTIGCALAAGYREVRCCATVADARSLADELGPTAVLAGERGGLPPRGFSLGNSPRELGTMRPPAEVVVLTTTNGTRALIGATTWARHVIVGSLVNLDACAAVADALAARLGASLQIVCAGSDGRPCLDDTYAAGRLARVISERSPARVVGDGARIAIATTAAFPGPLDALRNSSGGRSLARIGHVTDLEACAAVNSIPTVPIARADGSGAVVVSADAAACDPSPLGPPPYAAR